MGRRKKSTRSNEASKNNEIIENKPTNNNNNNKNNNATPITGSAEKPESEKTTKKTVPKWKIIDIYSRLELPLLKLTENNLSSDSDDEETLEFEIRPRFVFSFCLCLVCTELSDLRFICPNCRMVSYCTLEHREKNGPSHEKLCETLKREFESTESFLDGNGSNAENYRSIRIKMIERVEEALKRRLDLWERETILYPRVCRTCRKNGEDLIRCPDCMIEFYCASHRKNHENWCRDFQVFRRILTMQNKHGCPDAIFPDIARRECRKLEANIDELFFEIFGNNEDYKKIDALTYASMSLSGSAPLTALFALQNSYDDWTTRKVLRIDIVGAEFQFECCNLKVWEKLFMHYLPKLKTLHVRFTGPEVNLPNAPVELLSKVGLCRRCRKGERRIVVTFNERKLYHEVNDPRQLPVDLVCLFNPGLYRETGYDGTDSWPNTIEKFCRAKVPVVVTSYTEFEIPKDIERIKSIGKIEVILEPQKNPFASIKPDRNFVSDDIVPLMYKNYCISIIKGV